MSDYLWFLLNNKKFQQAVPIADEYYEFTTSPAYSRRRNRVSFAMIAQKFADSNIEETDKFYRAAFENSVEGTKTAMNIGYGRICVSWAAALDKFGKTEKSLAVLKEGMDFCRSITRWKDAFERNMPTMTKAYAEYLRKLGRNNEADAFLKSYESELISHKEKIASDHSKWLIETSNNPNQSPVNRAKALTELAYKSFEAHSCDEGLKQLQQAVAIYEENARAKRSDIMYSYFFDISDRLQKCSLKQMAQPILSRIVRAKLIYGFRDPLNRFAGCTLGMGHRPVAPLEDWENLAGKTKVLDELLKDAKANNRVDNVIYLLNAYNATSYGVDEATLARMEEIDEWREKDNNPSLLAQSLLHTADWCIALGHFDKANAKWKQALSVMTKNGTTKELNPYSLTYLSGAFMAKNRIEDAVAVSIAANELATQKGQPYLIERTADNLCTIAQKYLEKGDAKSGATLLKNVLANSVAKEGHDSFEERLWLIKLVNFYAAVGNKTEAKDYMTRLITSLNKPGMTVSKNTEEQMKASAQLLKKAHFETEAAKVEAKVAQLEMESCAAGAKHK